jgi:hypothetical protein
MQKKENLLDPKKVEEKLLDRFDFLKQEGGLHQIYSSYDFRLEEKSIKEVWEKILDFLLSDIFNNFGVTMSDLKKYTLIKNKIPVGLNNIIQELRIEQKYVTNEDLKDIKFYQINFPELYPQTKGYVSSFLGSLKSIMNFTGAKIGCNEDNDNNESLKVRTDISDEDKYKIIPDNQIIFNYEKFKYNCNNILSILNEFLQEDDQEIISTNNFIKRLKEKYLDKKENDEFSPSLPYGLAYLDIVLYYLEKIKKINLFNIVSNNKNVEFIKVQKTPTEPISNKDQAMAKTLSEMELLEKRNSELEKKSEQMLEKAKEQIKKGNKQNAKTCMLKRKNYLKFLETSQNTLNILEKQIFDLKNAESNANFADILKQTVEVGKQYSATADEFADVADDIKDQKDAINEIQSGIKDLALNTVDDDELDKELEELGKDKEEKKEEIEIFPSANNENIDDEKIFEELVKEDNK